jgi:hypothetical protein
MTTREKLEKMLYNMGLFETQASAIIDEAIPELEKLAGDYKITFNRPANEYPDMLFNIWFITVKEVAKNWIEKNIPNAWFKPMFN